MKDIRDQRDPQKLGEALLILREKHPGIAFQALANLARDLHIPDYDKEHMGPLEKYGDPRVLPSTLPN